MIDENALITGRTHTKTRESVVMNVQTIHVAAGRIICVSIGLNRLGYVVPIRSARCLKRIVVNLYIVTTNDNAAGIIPGRRIRTLDRKTVDLDLATQNLDIRRIVYIRPIRRRLHISSLNRGASRSGTRQLQIRLSGTNRQILGVRAGQNVDSS